MVDTLTFRKMIEDRLERYNNKAERTAFLVGLSMGAREMNRHERVRVCNDIASLWNIDISDEDDVPAVRKPGKARVPANTAAVGLDAGLLAKLAEMKR